MVFSRLNVMLNDIFVNLLSECNWIKIWRKMNNFTYGMFTSDILVSVIVLLEKTQRFTDWWVDNKGGK